MHIKHWPHNSRLRTAVLGSTLAIAAVGLAACGSSSAPPAATAGAGQNGRPQISSDQQARFKKFRDCMSSHGVKLPDLSKSGPPSGGPPAGVNPGSSTFQSAIQACRQYAPQMGGGPPGGSPPSF
jgi:hypothetical protein